MSTTEWNKRDNMINDRISQPILKNPATQLVCIDNSLFGGKGQAKKLKKVKKTTQQNNSELDSFDRSSGFSQHWWDEEGQVLKEEDSKQEENYQKFFQSLTNTFQSKRSMT